jgi:hypothetical protein
LSTSSALIWPEATKIMAVKSYAEPLRKSAGAILIVIFFPGTRSRCFALLFDNYSFDGIIRQVANGNQSFIH